MCFLLHYLLVRAGRLLMVLMFLVPRITTETQQTLNVCGMNKSAQQIFLELYASAFTLSTITEMRRLSDIPWVYFASTRCAQLYRWLRNQLHAVKSQLSMFSYRGLRNQLYTVMYTVIYIEGTLQIDKILRESSNHFFSIPFLHEPFIHNLFGLFEGCYLNIFMC